jgi:protein tyrosine/serine phosphatase
VEVSDREVIRNSTTARDWLRAGTVQAFIVALAFLFHRPMFLANFAAIDSGRAFRSAQLEEGLEATLEQNRIASVLNLRGGSIRDPWYRNEVETTAKANVDFYDFPLRPDRKPTRDQLLALVDLLEHCRYPILIHCKSGADRTGMASGLYLMIQNAAPPEIALREFSITHSHFPIGGPEHLHEPFHEYASWLKSKQVDHTPNRFRQWVREEYNDPDDDPGFQPIRPGARMANRWADRKARH